MQALRTWVTARRTWLLVAFALGFGVLFVFTGWRLANVASTLLLVPVGISRASKPRRVDARQARRLAEIGEREARLKQQRPEDYPAAPWLADPADSQRPPTTE